MAGNTRARKLGARSPRASVAAPSCQILQAVKEGLCDDGFKRVQLQLSTTLCGHRNGDVVASQRTTNPIESTFATVRLRTKVTKGPGSRAAGLAMVAKLSSRPHRPHGGQSTHRIW